MLHLLPFKNFQEAINHYNNQQLCAHAFIIDSLQGNFSPQDSSKTIWRLTNEGIQYIISEIKQKIFYEANLFFENNDRLFNLNDFLYDILDIMKEKKTFIPLKLDLIKSTLNNKIYYYDEVYYIFHHPSFHKIFNPIDEDEMNYIKSKTIQITYRYCNIYCINGLLPPKDIKNYNLVPSSYLYE